MEDFTKKQPFSRTILALCLACVWTIWKAQGQTIPGLLLLYLGLKDMDHGLSYVAFSMVIKLSHIGFDGWMNSNHITTMIGKLGNYN